MTERREHSPFRGLLERDAVEEDGTEVEDATRALLRVRQEERPAEVDGTDPADAS